jgi:hypothetical protein
MFLISLRTIEPRAVDLHQSTAGFFPSKQTRDWKKGMQLILGKKRAVDEIVGRPKDAGGQPRPAVRKTGLRIVQRCQGLVA